MRSSRLLLLALALSRLGSAAEPTETKNDKGQRPPDEKRRLDAVAAEVARRKLLRDAAQKAETDTRQLIRDHESGAKPATDSDLADARALLREMDEDRAYRAAGKQRPKAPPKPDDLLSAKLPGVDVETLSSLWQDYFGETLHFTEQAKPRTITVVFMKVPYKSVRAAIIAQLECQGLYIVHTDQGTTLDDRPWRASLQQK